jgi:two-component system OmpR family sensor kinase
MTTRMSLRRRLYLAAAVLVSVLGVTGVMLVRSVEASEFNRVDQQLTWLRAAALPAPGIVGLAPAQISVAGRASGAFQQSAPVPSKITFIGDFYVATVRGGHRTVIATPLDAAGQSPQTPVVTATAIGQSLRAVTVPSLVGAGHWRAALIREPGPDQEVLMALSLNQVDATITRLRLAVIAGGVLAVVVVAAAGFWVERLGLAPIAEITRVADRIAAGDRSRRVTGLPPGTEAGHLARAFNVMLDDQQRIEERLRQFVADASHELRTPLSVVQGFAGLWRQGELRSGDAHDDAMRRIGQESARMSRLVEDLLLLAHLDQGQPLERTSIDLVPLIREVTLDVSATHPSRTIDMDAAGQVRTQGDEASLRRVIVNLVSNAVTHTPSSATVTVHAAERSGQVSLEVTDSGPGMDHHGVQHAFDRFWRGDTSRTRAGSGLGLSIVAGIVSAHRGEVSLYSDPARGTTVRVVLPAGGPSS